MQCVSMLALLHCRNTWERQAAALKAQSLQTRAWVPDSTDHNRKMQQRGCLQRSEA